MNNSWCLPHLRTKVLFITQVGALDHGSICSIYTMRHQPCILNYHMLPFTVTPSPFRKCQTSVSKSGGIFEGGKGTQMASGIPQNLFIAERGPRTLYKQFVGEMSALGMAASHPSVERKVRAPELLSREQSEFVSDGRPSVSLLHLPPQFSSASGRCTSTWPFSPGLLFFAASSILLFLHFHLTPSLSHCPCPPCW